MSHLALKVTDQDMGSVESFEVMQPTRSQLSKLVVKVTIVAGIVAT